MAKLTVSGTAGFNAGKTYYSKPFRIGDIFIDPEISRIFAVQEKTRKEITRSIEEKGYDKSQPVVLWKGKNILVDGHTRLAAAKEAGLEEIPAAELEFDSREDALLYTFERQTVRRNLTASEILAAAQTLEAKKTRDGTGRAAEQLAERLGVSAATVYHAQKIAREAPEEVVEAVRKGERSIRSAYEQITEKKPKKEPEAGKAETFAKGTAKAPGEHEYVTTESPETAEAFVKEIRKTLQILDESLDGQTDAENIQKLHKVRSLLEEVLMYFAKARTDRPNGTGAGRGENEE
jgi:ParB family chromosome partitioning protein